MKRKLLERPPEWMTWSDGRALTLHEWKKFRFMRKRTQQPGESLQTWFRRVRDVVERYEKAQAAIVVKRPGVLRRAWNWIRGVPVGVSLLLPGRPKV